MVDPTPPKRPSAAADRESETDAAPETTAETTAETSGETADPAELADRFLDLWQDQLAAVATDPDLAETVAPLVDSVADHERASIEAALATTGGNKTRAAKLLGVPLRTFMEKVKRHGIR